jgi:hypothetical protein
MVVLMQCAVTKVSGLGSGTFKRQAPDCPTPQVLLALALSGVNRSELIRCVLSLTYLLPVITELLGEQLKLDIPLNSCSLLLM